MVRRRAWFLNFDAEDELAHAPGYTTSRAVLARLEALTDRVRALLAPRDVILRHTETTPLPPGAFVGRAWCPTPRALRAWKQAGAVVPATPSLSVLRRANHRRFCAELGQTLPGAQYCASLSDALRLLDGPGDWLLKRPFGFAGRGRRRVRPLGLDAGTRSWIEASFATKSRGGILLDEDPFGLQIEPWVTRTLDVGLHGFISAAGAITLGQPTMQRVDDHGAWVTSALAGPRDLGDGERGSLVDAAHGAANALRVAGYFGPFGLDAFRWADERGQPHFNPRCEINARYSMAWALGMGSVRPDLVD